MEVAALCFRLLMIALMLLAAQVPVHSTRETALAQIIPTTLQLFEYDPISFNCEGPDATTEWTVMRRVEGKVSECVSTWKTERASVCAIKPAYQTDSGEYWCEAGEERSNAVNISITGGSVILESPAVPVTEGDAVTLRCRTKMASSAHIADFYKDGLYVGSSFAGEMVIQGVSKSNEGLYKCSFSDFGESPESLLVVRGLYRETGASSDHYCDSYPLIRTVLTAAMVALLLLLVGQLHCGKLRVTQKYVCICKVCKGRCQTEQEKTEED